MPSLATFRQTAAQELGDYVASTADASGCSTTLLLDSKYPVKSSISQDTLYQDRWLLRAAAANAADYVRVVASYTASTGALAPDVAWVNAPTSEAYELHLLVEPWTQMNRLINNALKRCWVMDEVTLTPTADATRHSLAALTWITEPWQVRQVGHLNSTEDRAEVDPFAGRQVRGTVTQDAGVLYLHHPYQTFGSTETLYVLAARPAYTLCRASGGAYGDQSGLALNTDEAPVDATWVAAGVLVEAWRSLSHLLESAGQERVSRDRAEAASWFSSLSRRHFRLADETFRPLRASGMGWAR